MSIQWAGGSLPRCDGYQFRYAIYMHGSQLNEPVALFRTIEAGRIAIGTIRDTYPTLKQTSFMLIDLASGGEPS